MHLFFTVDDPVLAPNSKLATEYAELAIEGTNHKLTLLNSGHMCTLPYIPVCHRSFMLFGDGRFIVDWSRNITSNQKLIEAAEYERFFNSVLALLEDHFQ